MNRNTKGVRRDFEALGFSETEAIEGRAAKRQRVYDTGAAKAVGRRAAGCWKAPKLRNTRGASS